MDFSQKVHIYRVFFTRPFTTLVSIITVFYFARAIVPPAFHTLIVFFFVILLFSFATFLRFNINKVSYKNQLWNISISTFSFTLAIYWGIYYIVVSNTSDYLLIANLQPQTLFLLSTTFTIVAFYFSAATSIVSAVRAEQKESEYDVQVQNHNEGTTQSFTIKIVKKTTDVKTK
ncbi:hypothetical protein BED41_05665 [Cloacibacillus porcorum]|uniref:Uncharacterized protein n=2 Tax=Cloacibacillus porcorum TaxID=1197717 RepID=A0A1B2I3R0_9BACT|nr:hypothetical protein BED41_05665 [Cloacibacillus porcorum]